ncbi:MAG: RidA family protein [Methanolinea sp.]
MLERANRWFLLLVFVCGLLAGFGLYSLVVPAQHTTEKVVIETAGAPKPIGPYHQAVREGDLVFLSGQIGLDPATGNLSATIEEQTRRVMENQEAVLKEAGLDFSDVVQARIYLTNMSDWSTINGIYGEYFHETYPARATVMVAGLPKDASVEIETIASAH